jgi:predicted ABC-type ATPase
MVLLDFVGLDGPALKKERPALRALQSGRHVPTQNLQAHYPRTMENLAKSLPGSRDRRVTWYRVAPIRFLSTTLGIATTLVSTQWHRFHPMRRRLVHW